jgi:hypothetical protein
MPGSALEENTVSTQVVLAILAAAGVTVVDWLLGVLVAVRQHKFSLQKLPGQLTAMVLPYLGGSGILTVLQGWSQQYAGGAAGGSLPKISAGVAYAAISAYGLKVFADIWTKLGNLAGGPTNTAAGQPEPS